MIYRSPLPAPPIPELPLSEVVLERALEQADEVAFLGADSGRSVTFLQLAMGSAMAAAGWREWGLRKGEVVAICLPNIPEYAALFHSVLRAGGVAALLSPLLSGPELRQRCAEVGARAILTAGPLAAAAAEAGLPRFCVGEAEGCTPFLSLLSSPGEPVDIDPARDLAALVWSSGTEGLPRPVRFTHRNLVAGLAQIECLRYILPGDRVLGLLPYTHVYGALVGLCLPTRAGATVVSLMRFELGEFLRTLRDHHIAVAHLVPPLVSALALHPAVAGLELPALRGIVCGASALDPALARRCAERLGCYVVEGYGMTEALATHVVLDYEGGRHLGTVGQALPLTELRLVDPESRQPLPPGREGEIQCRGPALSAGYLGGPELLEADGWLSTGDLGRVDGEGRLVIVDRLKELIKRSGLQVAPALIEARLRACPEVADAVVLGLPDALEGEVPVGLVALAGPADLEELRRRVNAQGKPEEQLRWLRSIERVPRSLAGKLLRRQLRAELSLGPSGPR